MVQMGAGLSGMQLLCSGYRTVGLYGTEQWGVLVFAHREGGRPASTNVQERQHEESSGHS